MSHPASGDPPERVGASEQAPPSADAAPIEPARGTDPPAQSRRGEISHTKTARAHNALIAGAVVLILLLVFIIENTASVQITYFGLGFRLPLGVALMLAAIGGALLVGIVGTARIVQLRRQVRRPR